MEGHFANQILGAVSPWIQGCPGKLSVEVSRVAKRPSTGRNCRSAVLVSALPLTFRAPPNDASFWRGVRCAWATLRRGGGLWPKHIGAPHIQGFRNPPHNKIASAPVISARSIRAFSRMNSTAETMNTASKGTRVTLVIVVINKSPRWRHGSIAVSHSCQPPPRF
jgi:hypothetical protein